MDLIDFCQKVAEAKRHFDRMTTAEQGGNYNRGDGASLLAEQAMNELKAMFADCPQVTRETKFEDLPFAIGPFDMKLKDALYIEPVVEDETL